MSKVLGFTINIQGTDKAIETSEQLKRAISELQKELKKTEDVEAIKKLEAELVDLKARQAQVNAEVRESVKIRQRELNAVDEVSGTYDQLSRTLNEQRKRYKDLAAAGKDFTAEALQLRGEINQLDKQLKKIDADVGQFQRNVGGYTEALAQFFPRVSSGIGDITNGFQAAKGATTGFNKALGFLGVAVAVFQAVSDIFTQAIQNAKEFAETQKQIANSSGLMGAALDDTTARVRAITKTYGEDTRDVLNATNTLVKEFGISYADATNLIEAGLRKGANAQGDFLDQVREYPAQFAAAGGSAEEFVDILITAAEQGIYSDKGIDAIKEFGLRIREQTSATRDALTNAFGEQFTNRLFNNLNSGAITTVDALKEISKGLQDTSLTAKQVQTVIADTFGGAGEDAGLRYIQLLADINTETGIITASTNEYQSAQERLFEAQLQLEQSSIAVNEALAKTATETALLKTQFKTLVNEFIVLNTLEFFDRLPATLAGVVAAYDSLRNSILAINTGGLIGDVTNPFKAYNKAYKEAIREIKNQNAEQQKEQEEQAKKTLNTEAGLTQQLVELRKKRALVPIDSKEYQQLDNQIKEIESRLNKRVKKAGETTAKEYLDGSIAAIQKKANELKTAIEKAVAGSEAQKALIDQYNKQVQILEDAIANRNRIELQAEREAFLARVSNIETLTSSIAIPAVIKSENDLAEAQRKAILTNFKKVQVELNNNRKALAAADAAAKQQQKQQILDFIERGINESFTLINTLTAAANQKRNEVLQQQIDSTEANISELEERAGKATGIRKRLIEQQVAAEKKLLEEQTKRQEEEQKKQRRNEKRNALIQSIINGALAVQKTLATVPPPGNIAAAIATGVFAAIQTATIAAQPLATGGVVGISGRRVTDRANMPTRSNGDNVLATVKRGEVVLNERQQAALGGAATFRSIGVPGFATGGMVSPPLSAPSLPRTIGDAGNVIAALDRKTDAISARIDRLRAFVITEDIQREFDDAESIKVKAEL